MFEGGKLTQAGQAVNKQLKGEISKQLPPNFIQKAKTAGQVKYMYFPEFDPPHIALTTLGKKPTSKASSSSVEFKVRCRAAAGSAVKVLQGLRVSDIKVESLLDAESAAEGAVMGGYAYTKYNAQKPERQSSDQESEEEETVPVNVNAFSDSDHQAFQRGQFKGEAQNFARDLANTPANYLTPTLFAKRIEQLFASTPVKVIVRDESWAQSEQMGCFLGVTKGSCEPAKFIELHYGDETIQNPLVLIGKGVTFDSGGISLKPAAGMSTMKADMSGAGCVASSIMGLAKMEVNTRVVGLIPLCENMPSSSALKPGDVLIASDGTSVEIDNTDAEGRLILADALIYGSNFSPKAMVTVATLTGAIDVALGSEFLGVFASSNNLWKEIDKSGNLSGDSCWRMPLTKGYQQQLKKSVVADFVNAAGRSGGACTAAAFLWHFAGKIPFAHIDMAGTMINKNPSGHLSKGMNGGPCRLFMDFAERIPSLDKF